MVSRSEKDNASEEALGELRSSLHTYPVSPKAMMEAVSAIEASGDMSTIVQDMMMLAGTIASSGLCRPGDPIFMRFSASQEVSSSAMRHIKSSIFHIERKLCRPVVMLSQCIEVLEHSGAEVDEDTKKALDLIQSLLSPMSPMRSATCDLEPLE